MTTAGSCGRLASFQISWLVFARCDLSDPDRGPLFRLERSRWGRGCPGCPGCPSRWGRDCPGWRGAGSDDWKSMWRKRRRRRSRTILSRDLLPPNSNHLRALRAPNNHLQLLPQSKEPQQQWFLTKIQIFGRIMVFFFKPGGSGVPLLSPLQSLKSPRSQEACVVIVIVCLSAELQGHHCLSGHLQ